MAYRTNSQHTQPVFYCCPDTGDIYTGIFDRDLVSNIQKNGQPATNISSVIRQELTGSAYGESGPLNWFQEKKIAHALRQSTSPTASELAFLAEQAAQLSVQVARILELSKKIPALLFQVEEFTRAIEAVRVDASQSQTFSWESMSECAAE